MTKTYADFLNVVQTKVDLYAQIPERHLSVEGRSVYELYKAVEFLACFTSNATELLTMMTDDEEVTEAAKYAAAELRKIRRVLENLSTAEILAAAENLQTAQPA